MYLWICSILEHWPESSLCSVHVLLFVCECQGLHFPLLSTSFCLNSDYLVLNSVSSSAPSLLTAFPEIHLCQALGSSRLVGSSEVDIPSSVTQALQGPTVTFPSSFPAPFLASCAAFLPLSFPSSSSWFSPCKPPLLSCPLEALIVITQSGTGFLCTVGPSLLVLNPKIQVTVVWNIF